MPTLATVHATNDDGFQAIWTLVGHELPECEIAQISGQDLETCPHPATWTEVEFGYPDHPHSWCGTHAAELMANADLHGVAVASERPAPVGYGCDHEDEGCHQPAAKAYELSADHWIYLCAAHSA